MILYMLLNVSTLLFFTPKSPTTLKFNEPIEFFNIGNEGDFFAYKSKNGKILVIKPLIKKYDVPLVVITQTKNYQFQIKSTKDKSSPLYIVEDGEIDQRYKLATDSGLFKLLVGEKSIKLRKKNSGLLRVNGSVQKSSQKYYPKGGALIINGKRVL